VLFRSSKDKIKIIYRNYINKKRPLTLNSLLG
jgi:hypothetical protein